MSWQQEAVLPLRACCCLSHDRVSVVFVLSTGCFYRSDGLPAGWPKSSTPPWAALHNKGGSDAAHGFDEDLVTPTERIRARQAGFEHNVQLRRETKSARKGQTAMPRVHTFTELYYPTAMTATFLDSTYHHPHV